MKKKERVVPRLCPKCRVRVPLYNSNKTYKTYKCKICTKKYSTKLLNFKDNVIDFGVDFLRGTVNISESVRSRQSKYRDFFGNNEKAFSSFLKNGGSYSYEDENMRFHFPIEKVNNPVFSADFAPSLLFHAKKTLDDDNSNVASIWFFGVLFDVVRTKDFYHLNLDGDNVVTFSFLDERQKKMEKLDMNDSYARFTFTGTLWTLYRLGHFDLKNFLISFEEVFPSFSVGRFDWMMDFKNKTIEDVIFNFDTTRTPQQPRFDKDMNLETYYFGRYMQKDNKRALIRLYDKLKEAKAKKKEKFYPLHFEYDSVCRFEIEFRSMSVKEFHISLSDVLDDEKMKQVAKKYLQSSCKFMNFDFSGIEEAERLAIESNKALSSYFITRRKPLGERLKEIHVTQLEYFSLEEGVSPKNLIKMLQSQERFKCLPYICPDCGTQLYSLSGHSCSVTPKL